MGLEIFYIWNQIDFSCTFEFYAEYNPHFPLTACRMLHTDVLGWKTSVLRLLNSCFCSYSPDFIKYSHIIAQCLHFSSTWMKTRSSLLAMLCIIIIIYFFEMKVLISDYYHLPVFVKFVIDIYFWKLRFQNCQEEKLSNYYVKLSFIWWASRWLLHKLRFF